MENVKMRHDNDPLNGKFDIIENDILLKYFFDEKEREEYLKFKRFMRVLEIENFYKNNAIKEYCK